MISKGSFGEKINSIKIILTIIIVNWNNKNLLRDCLRSIYNIQSHYNYEIIVIDNNSEDGSAELIKNEFPNVVLIENDKNLGFAKANNQAIKIAKAKYTLLLNNDTIVTQTDCFDRMFWFMEENPRVGVLGCKLLFPDGTLQSLGERFPSVWEIFKSQVLFLKTWKRLMKKNKQEKNNFKRVDYISGACLLTRKEIFNKVGLLREDYFMYGEDAEFCYRVHKAGWEIGVLTNATITHLHSKSTEKNLSEMLYHAIINDLKNIKMIHNSEWQVLLAKIFHLIGILIRTILAIFRKDKNAADYLKLFKKLVVNRE